MPKEITELKKFLQMCRRKDAKRLYIKRNKNDTKFKIRCARYLYTLKLSDRPKAYKLEKSLPPQLTIEGDKSK